MKAMTCNEAKSLFSLHLDGALNGVRMNEINRHLLDCATCDRHYRSISRTQMLVTSLGRKPAPPELALRLRVAISQERSMSMRRRLQGHIVRFENAVNAFMLPATAGLVTAVIMFGLLIGFFALPHRMSAANDVPTLLYIPPRLSAAPFADRVEPGNNDSPVVVEAVIDTNGRVQDYRIISGNDTPELRKQLDRALIFTVFEPAMSFGQPASGRAVISFSNINVKG